MDKQNPLREEYENLKQHRACLDEMVAETDGKYRSLVQRTKECDSKQAKTLVPAAEHCLKRLNALKAALALADKELLHYLQLLAGIFPKS